MPAGETSQWITSALVCVLVIAVIVLYRRCLRCAEERERERASHRDLVADLKRSNGDTIRRKNAAEAKASARAGEIEELDKLCRGHAKEIDRLGPQLSEAQADLQQARARITGLEGALAQAEMEREVARDERAAAEASARAAEEVKARVAAERDAANRKAADWKAKYENERRLADAREGTIRAEIKQQKNGKWHWTGYKQLSDGGEVFLASGGRFPTEMDAKASISSMYGQRWKIVFEES